MPAGDWKSLAHACLSGGDYLLWKSEFYENCLKTAKINANQNIPITFEMLYGEGLYAETAQQLAFAVGVYEQTSSAAKRSWKALPESSLRSEEVSKIRQGPDEPFQEFAARLVRTAGRTFGESEASTALVTQLAYENANSACQAVLRPFRRKANLSDYIRLCSDIGPSYIQGLAIAAGLQGKTVKEVLYQNVRNKKSRRSPGVCYGCGQSGHYMKQCPSRNPGAPSTGHTEEGTLPPLC